MTRRATSTIGHWAAAVAVSVHGIAHLAVYPVSGSVDADIDASRFWVPLSMVHDAEGWAARVLLVVAAVAFLLTGHVLAGGRLSVRWTVPALVGACCSIGATVLLWRGLRPRPEALWFGGLISVTILLLSCADLAGRRRSDDQVAP